VSLVPNLSVLPPAQRALWSALGATRTLGFVLYDGTALALRIGHRTSEDFDFFSDRPLDRGSMRQAFPFLDHSERIQEEKQTLTVLVSSDQGEVKVSFFGAPHMGRVGVPDLTNDGVLEIASPDDLLAFKLKVILERAEAKDYQDIAVMLASGSSLTRGLGSARALFGTEFAPAIALRALTYFDDPALQGLSREDRVSLSSASASASVVPQVEVVSKKLSV
jgi:hypothetical protein